jgi:hypothetical protein
MGEDADAPAAGSGQRVACSAPPDIGPPCLVRRPLPMLCLCAVAVHATFSMEPRPHMGGASTLPAFHTAKHSNGSRSHSHSIVSTMDGRMRGCMHGRTRRLPAACLPPIAPGGKRPAACPSQAPLAVHRCRRLAGCATDHDMVMYPILSSARSPAPNWPRNLRTAGRRLSLALGTQASFKRWPHQPATTCQLSYSSTPHSPRALSLCHLVWRRVSFSSLLFPSPFAVSSLCAV